jgi:hypothetical protein
MRERHIGYVNQIIDRLHDRAENYEAYLPDALKKHVEPSNNRKGYLEMGQMLNALPADVKTEIGMKIAEYLNNIRGSGGMAHFARSLNGENPLFVFHFSSGIADRGKRAMFLHGLLTYGLFSYQLTDGLAVSMNADDPSEGFEILMIKELSDYGKIDQNLCRQLYPNMDIHVVQTIE